MLRWSLAESCEFFVMCTYEQSESLANRLDLNDSDGMTK